MRPTAKILAVAAAATLMLTASTGTTVAQKIAKFDTNNDGVVSMQEFKEGHTKKIEKRFGKIDVNADGVLDQEELAAHKVRKEKRRKKRAG